MDSVNQDLFEKMPIPRAAAKLMIPTVLGSLVMVLYSMADTYFVGMLNNEIQSAAVSLAAPVLMAFNFVNNLFGVGASSMMSRGLGRKDYDAVKNGASVGIYGSIFASLLLSLCCYLLLEPLLLILGATEQTMQATSEYMFWTVLLGAMPSILNVVMAYLVRAEGEAFHASVGTMTGCLLNVVLDPICILPWGLNMGAAGAGMATFISNCIACLYFVILLTKRRAVTHVQLSPKYFKTRKEIVLDICNVGIPASIQNLLNVTSMTVMNNFVSSYGPSAVAAIGIAQKIYMVPLQIALGGSQGMMPMLSYTYAGKLFRRFKGSLLFSCKLMIPAMTVVSIGCWIFAEPLIHLFIQNADIVRYGTLFLRGYSACMPFMLVDFIAVGVFQSVGMGKKALEFAILRKIVFEIPAIIVLNMIFHEQGITYAPCVAEIILAIDSVFQLKKILTQFKNRCNA